MNETVVIIVVPSLVLLLLAFGISATIWRKRKGSRRSAFETEQFIKKEIEINEIPSPETKIASVQPISQSTIQVKYVFVTTYNLQKLKSH